ncbi:MAG: DUF1292 domain-containing protein [Acholeplasmatales bacterium]|nr:DUF1292 domain-containing protein [Acholeplasmatales bacterium]
MKEEIVTLNGENGQKIDFYLDCELEYDDECYQVLRPVNDKMGLNPDEALVFLVEEVDGEASYSLITDDDLLAEIENVYNNMEH